MKIVSALPIPRGRENGQASVEFLATVPVVVLVALAAWQLALAGQTWWRLTEAARVAAREVHLGQQRGDERGGLRKARQSAEAILGGSSLGGTVTSARGESEVRVSARIPLVGPFRVAEKLRQPRLAVRSRLGR